MQPSNSSRESSEFLDASGHGRMDRAFGKVQSALLVGIYLVIFGIAIGIKYAYHTFDAEKSFADTSSYTAVADLPITSPGFWSGPRPFTVPLFYKLLGVSTANYTDAAVMRRVSWVQSGLSILAWAVLGLALAAKARNRWLGALIFGMVLAFSLIYEISRWDLTLLSESLAFSFFALTLAGWIELLSIPVGLRRSSSAYLLLVGLIVLTILFSFTRDVNEYIIVMGASILVVVSFFQRSRLPINLTLPYLVAVMLIFFAQTASINIGNRWQIFLYNRIAYRFIDTPEFVDYFSRAGMPTSPLLYKPPEMHLSAFQNMLSQDPRLDSFRQWINLHGKPTYLGYLLAHPIMTLSEPLVNSSEIFAGTATETLYETNNDWYRNPMHKNEYVPRWIRGLTKLMFIRLPNLGIALVYIGQVCLTAWAFIRKWNLIPWVIIGIFVITTYPLMLLIWHGDPIEIVRHALPVSIGFRLATWLALAFLLDHLLVVWGRTSDLH